MNEKATQIYRVEFNGKYFWFSSLIGEFTKAFKIADCKIKLNT